MARILLIGDDLTTHSLLADMLKLIVADKYELHHETDPKRAATNLQNGDFDVGVIDSDYGGLGETYAIEFLTQLQDYPDCSPVIILAEHPNKDLDVAAIQLGAVDYLIKPFLTPDSLERALRYAIERQRIIGEFRRNQNRLSEINEIKDDIIRIAAHDLRTPVATILLSTDLLMRDPDNQRLRSHIQRIWQASRTVQRIVTEILSLDYINNTQGNGGNGAYLRDFIYDAIEDHRSEIEAKSLKIETDVPDSPLKVSAERIQLQQAVYNLIQNAIKYTPENGEIRIQLQRYDHHVSFYVQDTGYGIPEADQDSIFEPFFRSKTQQTENISGTGLGLYLVKRIVERYNGKVTFDSVYGKGSTIGFELPVA
jgi:signal transduction histidine kinase